MSDDAEHQGEAPGPDDAVPTPVPHHRNAYNFGALHPDAPVPTPVPHHRKLDVIAALRHAHGRGEDLGRLLARLEAEVAAHPRRRR